MATSTSAKRRSPDTAKVSAPRTSARAITGTTTHDADASVHMRGLSQLFDSPRPICHRDNLCSRSATSVSLETGGAMRRLTTLALALALALAACAPNGGDQPELMTLTYQSSLGAIEYTGMDQAGVYLFTPGDVMTGNPHGAAITIYPIFYGSAWSKEDRQIFLDFITGLSGSPQWDVLVSYDDQQGHSVPPLIALPGATPYYIDSGYSQGQSLTDGKIDAIVTHAVSKAGWPSDPSGIYMVVPDKTVFASTGLGTFCGGLCAYHPTGASGLHAVFALDPDYCPDQTGCNFPGPSGIGPNQNGSSSAPDAMVSSYWHEIAEQLTDPDGKGYRITPASNPGSQREIGDACEAPIIQDRASSYPATLTELNLDYTADNGGDANERLGNRDFLIQSIWTNTDRGGCVRRLALNHPAAQTAPFGFVTGDLDGNGVGDLLFRDQYGGELNAYLLDRNDQVMQSGFISVGSFTMRDQIYGYGDMDADGSADLLWLDLDSRHLYVQPMGALNHYSAVQITSHPLAGDELVKAIGDFNGDARDDVLFQRTKDNTTRIGYLSSSLTASIDLGSLPITTPSAQPDDNSDVVGTGDFDGDGRAEVLWHDLTHDTYRTWKFSGGSNTSGATVTSTVLTLAGCWRVLGIVDVDGDGQADLIGQSSDQSNVVWLKMSHGVPAAAQTILPMPDPRWRFAGGSRFGSGQTGLLWYDRHSGLVARWLVDKTGSFVRSDHLIGGLSSNFQLVNN
jgi:hypothetical protein